MRPVSMTKPRDASSSAIATSCSTTRIDILSSAPHCSGEVHSACCQPSHCGYDAKQGRLAGTIRADQARDFALTDGFAGTDLSATGLACRYGLLAAVVVEAALRLAAEPAGLDVFHQQRAG